MNYYGASSLGSGVAAVVAASLLVLLLLLAPSTVEGSTMSATMRFMEHLHGSEGGGGASLDGGRREETQQLYGEHTQYVDREPLAKYIE